MNHKPDFIKGEILTREYDGVQGDLLTGGLGKTGLMQPPPVFEARTAEALRTLAIYNSYRGLLDMSPEGGFGALYGPNVNMDRNNSDPDGKIAGKEYLAFGDDGSGRLNEALMVQIPRAFNPKSPCIITAPASGSRGIYGAVPTVGEWALKRGFAVAYTDKGAGLGMHDLDQDTVILIDGVREQALVAGRRSSFTAVTPPEFNRDFPHRIAFKHAHSRQNCEKDWGRAVLWAIRFAYYVLNLEENYGVKQPNGDVLETIVPQNTIVIASGVSNGGSASIRAAEQDVHGLINGIAVSEPNLTPAETEPIVIRQGRQEWRFPNVGRSMLDYMTLLNMFQPAANLVPDVAASAPMNFLDRSLAENRLNALKASGLLTGQTLEECAVQAEEIIHANGLPTEQRLLRPSHYAGFIYQGICVTYANAYGGFGPEDRLAGYSFAAVDPETSAPTPLSPADGDAAFASGNGIPPTAGVTIIADHSKHGPVAVSSAVSGAGQMDLDLEGALTLRRLLTGVDESGVPLSGLEQSQHERIIAGISAIKAAGNLKGLPTIIVHGRNDAILPPNHTSRAYAALNQLKEGKAARLRYYEVTNAHHLDFLNQLPGFNRRFVPLHWYFLQALDLMYAHLKEKKDLPPSQVLRARPRGTQGDAVPPLSREHLPPITDTPAESDRIRLSNGTIEIPD